MRFTRQKARAFPKNFPASDNIGCLPITMHFLAGFSHEQAWLIV